MNRTGNFIPRALLVIVVVLFGLVIAAFALAHVGGGHGIAKLF